MPLNGITLGQTITDTINRMITISKLASTFVRYERLILELVSLYKFDTINRLKSLSVIPFSSAHCNNSLWKYEPGQIKGGKVRGFALQDKQIGELLNDVTGRRRST